MKRVLIIGGNGAGKSTFSFALAEKTGLPLIHIDQIYWHGTWEVTPREEFQSRVLAEACKPSWIIEGNNIRTLGKRLDYADTVFWFEFPPIVCVLNVLKREWKYRNQVRPDMPDECVSRLRFSFLKEVWGFNKKNRVRIEECLREAKHVQVIRFTNYGQVRKFLAN